MKLNVDASSVLVGLAAVAIGVGAFVLYKKRDLFNPANDKNLANQGVGVVIQKLTGGADAGGEDSLGGIFASWREKLFGTNAAIEELKKGAPGPDPVATRAVAEGLVNASRDSEAAKMYFPQVTYFP